MNGKNALLSVIAIGVAIFILLGLTSWFRPGTIPEVDEVNPLVSDKSEYLDEVNQFIPPTWSYETAYPDCVYSGSVVTQTQQDTLNRCMNLILSSLQTQAQQAYLTPNTITHNLSYINNVITLAQGGVFEGVDPGNPADMQKYLDAQAEVDDFSNIAAIGAAKTGRHLLALLTNPDFTEDDFDGGRTKPALYASGLVNSLLTSTYPEGWTVANSILRSKLAVAPCVSDAAAAAMSEAAGIDFTPLTCTVTNGNLVDFSQVAAAAPTVEVAEVAAQPTDIVDLAPTQTSEVVGQTQDAQPTETVVAATEASAPEDDESLFESQNFKLGVAIGTVVLFIGIMVAANSWANPRRY